MFRPINIAFLGMTAMLMSACVSNQTKPVEFDQSTSLAKRITDYAHFDKKMKDDPPEVYKDFQTIGSRTPIIDASLLIGYSFFNWEPPAGSVGMGITASLWSFVPKPEKKDPRYTTQILAWMPEEMANTKEEARDKLNNIVFKATKKTIKVDNNQWTVKQYKSVPFLVHSSYSARAKENNHTIALYLGWDFKSVKEWPQLTKSPKELGEQTSWQFSQKQFIYSLNKQKPGEFTGKQPGYAHFQKLSENLPSWAWIYVPPYKDFKTNKIIRPFPIMFNNGKLHLFVQLKDKNVAINQ